MLFQWHNAGAQVGMLTPFCVTCVDTRSIHQTASDAPCCSPNRNCDGRKSVAIPQSAENLLCRKTH